MLTETLESSPLNPSSVHAFGQRARTLITGARREIAELMGARPTEVFFHSGATEGLNLAIRSLGNKRIVSSKIEHAAVFETLRSLDVEVIYLPIGPSGAPEIVDLEKALEEGAEAIVLSAANSETGVLLDLEGAAALAGRFNVPFICDTTALVGKGPLIFYPGVTSMHFSAHKFHGPVGIGFSLFRMPPKPLVTGGGQEFGVRSGTLSAPLVIALAKALRLSLEFDRSKIESLRDLLERGILERVPFAKVNGVGPRLVNTTSIAFPDVEGDALFMALDLAGIAVSLGSACASGALEPSRVISEMGGEAMHSVRFSLSRLTTKAEIEKTIELTASLCRPRPEPILCARKAQKSGLNITEL